MIPRSMIAPMLFYGSNFPLRLAHSILQAIPRLENPRDRSDAERKEKQRHRKADADMHVGRFKEAPAEAADQIDDRVEQRDFLPERREDGGRGERCAAERQRGGGEQ